METDQKENEQELWKSFRGKSNSNDILTEKAKALATFVMDFARMATVKLAEHFEKNKKIKLSEENTKEIFLETAVFYTHFIDRIAFQSLKTDQRNFFMSVLVKEISDIFSKDQPTEKQKTEFGDIICDIYNLRQVEYGNYKKLVPENEGFGGTLFWEFSKRISNILGLKEDIVVMAEIQTFLVGGLKFFELQKLFEE